jgi:restriction endonuclease Mrr
METPTFSQLFCPVADAIRENGGTASNQQILEGLMKRGFEKGPERKDSNRTELEYRVAWAKSYLKAYGALENPSRGVWRATDKLSDVTAEKAGSIVNYVVGQAKKNKRLKAPKKLKQKVASGNAGVARPVSGVSLIDQAKTIITLMENGILTKSAANAALIKLTEVHLG